MTTFTKHTVVSAPQGSKGVLEGAQSQLGFVPNLYGNMAESPSVLESYMTIAGFFEKTSFDATEIQVILLTTSVVNNCKFCVAAHSVISKSMLNIDGNIIDAIRNQEAIQDSKLKALATFTHAVVTDSGRLDSAVTDVFLAAGYNQAQALEVVLGVSIKALSNYTNQLTQTQVNAEFVNEAWSKAA